MLRQVLNCLKISFIIVISITGMLYINGQNLFRLYASRTSVPVQLGQNITSYLLQPGCCNMGLDLKASRPRMPSGPVCQHGWWQAGKEGSEQCSGVDRLRLGRGSIGSSITHQYSLFLSGLDLPSLVHSDQVGWHGANLPLPQGCFQRPELPHRIKYVTC